MGYYLDDMEESFFKDAKQRFLECVDAMNSTVASYDVKEYQQRNSSKYIIEKLNSEKSDFIIGNKFKVHKKKITNKGKAEKDGKLYEFTAIKPFCYEKIYDNGTSEIFDYIEIHTENIIYAFLYEHGFDLNKILDRSSFTASKVLKCLRITKKIQTQEAWTRLSNTWKKEDVENQIEDNEASIEDFELIFADPNAKFLLCYLAYSILACCEKEIWDFFEFKRIKTDIPFLLSVYYEFKKEDKTAIKKCQLLKNYLIKIHSACYMPEGDFIDDYMPKENSEYENYINSPSRANNVTLLIANKFSVEAALPSFIQTIERASMEFKDYPYTSLPFIVTPTNDGLPQRYFLQFNAEEIETGNAAFENLPTVMGALTRIAQTACIRLSIDNYENPSIVSDDFNELIRKLKHLHPLFSTTSKRANDLVYLLKIILCTIHAIFVQSSSECDEDRITKMYTDTFMIMLREFDMSVDALSKSENLKTLPMADPITKLLNCIVEDLESTVFASDTPQTNEDLSSVQFAFRQGDLLCFTRASEAKGVPDSFESYLKEKGLLKDYVTPNEIWDELKNSKYQGLIARNSGTNYHKYTHKDIGSVNTYAFDIAAVKDYLNQQKTL